MNGRIMLRPYVRQLALQLGRRFLSHPSQAVAFAAIIAFYRPYYNLNCQDGRTELPLHTDTCSYI